MVEGEEEKCHLYVGPDIFFLIFSDDKAASSAKPRSKTSKGVIFH